MDLFKDDTERQSLHHNGLIRKFEAPKLVPMIRSTL